MAIYMTEKKERQGEIERERKGERVSERDRQGERIRRGTNNTVQTNLEIDPPGNKLNFLFSRGVFSPPSPPIQS